MFPCGAWEQVLIRFSPGVDAGAKRIETVLSMSDVSPKPQSKQHALSASAKRVGGWTAKGLLSVVVLIVGVGFGREVLMWWNSDDAPPIRLPSPGMLGDLEKSHSIHFGDAAWSLNRRSVEGNRDEAAEQLRADCRALLQSIKTRPSVAPNDSDDLAFLAGATPVDSEPGRWRLYEFAETFPMAVAVADSADDLATADNRAIIWAIAVPTGEARWSLCVFSPTDSTAKKSAAEIAPPLPPGGRRTMSIEANDGEAITAFTGPNEPEQWRRSFDRWFAERNWRQTAAWRKIGKAWYIKYVSPDSDDCAVEVRFGPDARGGLSGLLMITPLRPK